MKVFLSWSGEVSHSIARVFEELLPAMFEDVKPFLSSEIDKGKRWNTVLADELRDTAYGIICLTRANLDRPWILFEAGALSKLDTSHVSTFLLGLKRSEVKPPLAEFQDTLHSEDDVRKLIISINRSLDRPRVDANLEATWRMWWPQFKAKIDPLEEQANQEAVEPPNETGGINQDTLEEILQLVRDQQRRLSSPENILPPEYLASIGWRTDRLRARYLKSLMGTLSKMQSLIESDTLDRRGFAELRLLLLVAGRDLGALAGREARQQTIRLKDADPFIEETRWGPNDVIKERAETEADIVATAEDALSEEEQTNHDELPF